MRIGLAAFLGMATAAIPSGLAAQAQARVTASPQAALPASATPAAPPQSEAMVAAMANRARTKVRPELRSGGKPAYPDEERYAGHGGTAMVRGILGTDGRLSELTVTKGTGFPALDADALTTARAALFSTAKDAEGNALVIPITLPVVFNPDDLTSLIVTNSTAVYPDTERAAGHHGKVEISGTLGPDGRIVDPQVSVSSKAPGLDDAALVAARAMAFRVPRDASGKLLPQQVRLPFSFGSFHLAGKGGSMLGYRCDQFVLDQDWWRATWPAETHDEFYFMTLGLRTIMAIAGRGMGAVPIKDAVSDFGNRWVKAIEACRRKPEALFFDVFKPEGDWIRRLAENGMM